jgi:carnitine 3-dehydrogenase
MVKLSQAPGVARGTLTFTPDLKEVAESADFIQENAPENEDLKRRLLAQIDALAPADVIIASSSSGLLPTRIQADCRHPERIVIGHPFNPVYLLPLVEVLGGEKTSAATIADAMAFYERIGMHPLKVRTEVEGYISDRLQEALWREALHMVNEGVATTGEIDDAVIYGPGLRWAFMGTCLTFHLAGGEDGMRHMLEQFGPALELPWTKLKAPALTETLIDRMVEGTQAQAAGRSIRELERLRNDCLVDIMRVLRQHRVGAGQTLARDEARRYAARPYARWTPGAEIGAPLALYRATVDPQWVDYNGHMSESFYLLAFGDASDALFRYVGIDEAYRDAGLSFYTAETHINYLKEVASGEPLEFTTQLLGVDDKRLHFFHRMVHGATGDLVATTEQMLLHVDSATGRTAPIRADVRAGLDAIMAVHAALPAPPQKGRVMAVPA